MHSDILSVHACVFLVLKHVCGLIVVAFFWVFRDAQAQAVVLLMCCLNMLTIAHLYLDDP